MTFLQGLDVVYNTEVGYSQPVSPYIAAHQVDVSALC